jgi:hypothetical protein
MLDNKKNEVIKNSRNVFSKQKRLQSLVITKIGILVKSYILRWPSPFWRILIVFITFHCAWAGLPLEGFILRTVIFTAIVENPTLQERTYFPHFACGYVLYSTNALFGPLGFLWIFLVLLVTAYLHRLESSEGVVSELLDLIRIGYLGYVFVYTAIVYKLIKFLLC